MKKVLKNVFKGMFSVLGIITLFSCEIGLGDAVDTEPPQFEITSPKDAAIIRGPFRIGGTWTDDGSVSKAEIELSRPDGYGVRETYSTNITKDSWYGIVDPTNEGHNLVDGTYIAKITLYDDGGHSTSKTRQFTIDNTPPVLVLQKPSSTPETAETEITSYGQIFNIQGQSADDSNVDKIVVKFYADSSFTGEPIAQVVKETVPATIDLDIATYTPNNTDINDVYSTIYGSRTPKGTEDKIYFKIEAYDGAKKYSLDDGLTVIEDFGNMTDSYYRYNDIATEVLAKNNIKVTDLYHMNSGFYTLSASRSASASQAEVLTKAVAESLKNFKIEKGRISLNPENNPSFSISGHKSYVKGGTEEIFHDESHNVTNGSNIVMEVAVGLDAWPLNEDIWFYLLPCDVMGKVDENAPKMFIDATRTPAGTSYKFVAALSSTADVFSESPYGKTEAEKAVIKLPNKLEIGKNYVIRIWGTDQKGNGVLADKNANRDYAVHLSSSGAAPDLKVESPEKIITNLKKESELNFKGSVDVEEGLPTVKITKTVGDDEIVVWEKTFTASEGNKVGGKVRYNFDYTIDKDQFSQTESTQNSYSISAAQDGQISSATRTVMYDVFGPSIDIQSLTPYTYNYLNEKGEEELDADGTPVQYLNGKINARIQIQDEDTGVETKTNAPKFEFFLCNQNEITENSPKGAIPQYTLNPFKQEIKNIDTALWKGADGNQYKGPVTLRITATDVAGNETVVYGNYKVDQDTDKPVILPNSPDAVTFTYTTKEALEAENKSSSASSGQVFIKLIDDDGLQSISIYRQPYDDVGDVFEKVPTSEPISGTEIVYAIILPGDAGYYRYGLKVKDIYETETVLGPFVYRVTAPAPTITNITTEPRYITTKTGSAVEAPETEFKNTIGISSTENPFYIFRKTTPFVDGDISGTKPTDESNFVGKEFLRGKTETSSFNDIITKDKLVNEDSTVFYYRVYDKNWNESNKKDVECLVDAAQPTVTLNAAPTRADTKAAVSSFAFQGTANDPKIKDTKNEDVAGSGIREVRITVSGKDSSNATITKTVKATGTANWLYSLTYADEKTTDDIDDTKNSWKQIFAEQGEKSYSIVAIDNAGNISSAETGTFIYDTADPTSDITGIQEDMPGAGYTIKGTASDTYELKEIIIKQTKTGEDPISAKIALDGKSKKWERKLPFKIENDVVKDATPTDGTYAYEVRVYDKAGNDYLVKTFETTVDMTAPTLLFSSDLYENSTSKKRGLNAINETNFRFEGTFVESKISGIYYAIVANGATCPAVPTGADVLTADKWAGWTKATTGTSNWNFVQSFKTKGETGDSLPEGKYKLYMYAVDKAGNVSSEYTLDFDVDMADPTITNTTIVPTANTNSQMNLNGNTIYFNGSLSVSATSSDTNGLAATDSLVIKLDGTKITDGKILDTSYTDETTKKVLSITATDVVGKTKTVTYDVYKDKTAPSITITNPDSDVAGDDALSGDINKKYTFRGSLDDSGVGLENFKYKFEAATGSSDVGLDATTVAEIKAAATADGSNWENGSGSSIKVEKQFVAGKTDTTNMHEGKWFLYVYAKDKVGNESVAKRSFWVDLANPTLDIKLDGNAFTTTSSTSTASTGFKFTFNPEDTNGLASPSYVLTAKRKTINDTDLTPFTPTVTEEKDGSGKLKNYLMTITGDGSYEFTITANDISGKSTTVTKSVLLDTQGPVIEITSPDLSAWQTSSTVKLTGTAKDLSEIKGIYYQLDSASTPTVPSGDKKIPATWTGSNWKAVTGSLTNWSLTLSDVSDKADHKLYYAAVDSLGNVSAVTEKTIKVDTTGPSLQETNVGLAGKKINAGNMASNLTLSGTFAETLSGIASITITDDKNSNSKWQVTLAEGATSWSQLIEIGNSDNKLKDEEHVLTITAKDKAGNVTTLQRSVTVDTLVPTLTGLTIESTPTNGWHKTNSIKIKATGIGDTKQHGTTEGTGYASGVLSVQYTTDDPSSANAVWIAFGEGAERVTSVNCPVQGKNTISVKVTDAAENTSVIKSQTVYIDTEAVDTAGVLQINTAAANLNETYHVNGKSDLIVYIYTEDSKASTGNASGIASVALSKIGTKTSFSSNTKTEQYSWAWYNSDGAGSTVYTKVASPLTTDNAYTDKLCTTGETAISTSDGKITVAGVVYSPIPAGVYKVTINKDDFATGIVNFDITDKVGNRPYTYSTFQMDYDNKYPSATISAISDADTSTPSIIDVNKTFVISGSAKDDKTLQSVKLQYTTATYDSTSKTYTDGTTWVDYPAADGSFADMASWSVSIDTENAAIFTDKNYYAFRAVATDSAGNVGNSYANRTADGSESAAFSASNVAHIYVNQDSDRPRITFSNLELGNSMSSSNYVYITNLNTIYGNIVDDDGIKTFEYTTDSNSTPTSIIVSNGGFTIPSLPEGAQKIIFKVVDNKDTAFISTASSGPKLKGSEADAKTYDTDTQLYLRVNTKRPEITNAKFYRYDANISETNKYETTPTAKESITTIRFGGTRHTKVKIEVDVQDKNGVAKVELRKADDAGTKVKDFTCNDTSHSDDVKHTWTVTDVDLSGNTTSGTYGYKIVAVDANGTANDLEGTDDFQLVMDMTAPTMEITSHSNGAAIRTSFTLKGTVDDATASMKYLITASADEPTATEWNSAKQYRINEGDSLSYWSITFDGDTENPAEEHTYDQKTWFVKLYGAAKGIVKNSSGTVVEKCTNTECKGNDNKDGCTGTHNKYRDKQNFYLHFQLTDSFGNTSTNNRYSLNVDPQGDIPVVTMNYPIAESYAYYSETGTCWYYQSPEDFDISTKYNDVKTFTVDSTQYTDFKYKGPYASASGRISVSGTAEDDKTIKGLYMQIDPSYSPAAGFKWTATDGATIATHYTAEDIYNKYNGSTKGTTGIYIGNDTTWNIKLNANNEFNGQNGANNTIAIKLLAVDEDGNIYEGGEADVLIITIDSGAPKIGETSKMVSDTSQTVGVAFSVWQYAWTNTTSGVTTTVYTNTEAPTTSTLAYDNSGCTGTGTAIAAVAADKSSITVGGKIYTASFINRAYTDGMWLNGMWWLVGSVEDESGISSIKIGDTSIINDYCEAKEYLIDKTTYPQKNDYIVRYPIGRTQVNTFGNLSYTLNIQDNQEKENSATFSINYDNKRPELLKSDASHRIDKDVVNTDGFYTLVSAVNEGDGESGFARTVVYFKRTSENFENIYDVFLGKTNSPISYAGLHEEDGMYWKEATVTGISNKKLTVTTTDNVHKGGIVKFGGTIYTITEKTGTDITLDEAPNESLNGQKIYFGIGAVIDKVGTEGASNNATKITSGEGIGYWNSISGDDDFMIERVTKQGTKSIWEGNINTKNIPDGPIEIHYVVYDKAGNSSHGVLAADTSSYETAQVKETAEAFVRNNAPMIASVTVATTFSGGDTPEYEETYYVSEKTRKISGKEVKKSISVSNNVTVAGNENGTRAFMTIKDKSWVKPEIVGGNGALSYKYQIDNNDEVSGGALGNATKDGGEDYLNTIDENELKYVNGQVLTFPITTDILSGITTNSTIDAPTTFLYTISDSTEGVSGGLSATVNLKLAVNYNDVVSPKAVILPFEWNGTGKTEYSERENNEYKVRCYVSNNSIYESELTNGHIELKEDLDYTGTKFTAASGLMDKDPKVSGKISIRGYAYDDIRLSNLWIKMDNFTFAKGTTGTGTAAGYVKAASYTTADGWTSYGDISDGWKFTIFAHDGSSAYEDLPVLTETSTDDDKAEYEKIHNMNLGKYYGSYFNQRGHKVYWQLDLDTEKLSTVAGVDKKVYLMVEDERGAGTKKYSSSSNSDEGESGDEKLNTPNYQMDVVPYITKVYTKLSKQKLGSWSTYGRTALGHYTVADNETVYIYGFNLGNTTYKPQYNATDLDIPVSGKDKNNNYPSGNADESVTGEDYSSYSVLRFPVSTFTTSGELAIKVNSISTLNNLNRNEAAGTSKKRITNTADKTGTSTSDKLKYAYNLLPNSDNNNILTDDLEFDVWHINDAAAKPTSGAVNDVVMKINPSNNMVGFAFVNGQLNFAMPNRNTSYTNWQQSYETYHSIGLAYDSNGDSFAVGAGGDSNGHQADLFNFLSSKMGVGTNNGKNGSNNGTNALRLESIAQKLGTNTNNYRNDAFDVVPDRIQSPSIITSRREENNTTHVYLAYWDKINDEIRFRVGKFADNTTAKPTWGTIKDYFEGNELGDKNNDSKAKNANYGYYWDGGCQILATTTGTNKTGTNAGDNTPVLGNAGPYVSIGVVKNKTQNKDVVVMVWFDQVNKKLCYAYNTSPTTARTGINYAGWTKGPDILKEGEGGEYCQLAVDAGGGIHIAAYTGLNNEGNLKYAYLSSYDDTTPEVCTVDSNGIVGDNLTIDVATVNGKYVPYIGYYTLSMAMPKYAYKVSDEVKDGITKGEEAFNGNWEVTIIPTSSAVSPGRINVGVFKTSEGVRTYSTTNKQIPTINNIGQNSAGAGNGNCYGNGSNNPILGYAITISGTESWVETAQMK